MEPFVLVAMFFEQLHQANVIVPRGSHLKEQEQMLGIKPVYIPVPAVLFFHVTFLSWCRSA